MILGFHFIFSAYGFWLPNDPRGSWSDVVRQYEIAAFGAATKVTTTRSVAAQPHNAHARQAAKRALRYPPVRFTGRQARAIGTGLATACVEAGYTTHAAAVPPDHVHLITAWHPRPIDAIASHLKARATRAMTEVGLHPMTRFAATGGRLPSPWARGYWCPFIRGRVQLARAIRYVEDNPAKAGLRRQRWSFVQPWTG